MNKTAVEWLAEKYEYVNWMRNRDEISPGLADEWRKHYLEQAKLIEKDQLCALYMTLLLNTPDIAQFDFEEWYKQNTSHE